MSEGHVFNLSITKAKALDLSLALDRAFEYEHGIINVTVHRGDIMEEGLFTGGLLRKCIICTCNCILGNFFLVDYTSEIFNFNFYCRICKECCKFRFSGMWRLPQQVRVSTLLEKMKYILFHSVSVAALNSYKYRFIHCVQLCVLFLHCVPPCCLLDDHILLPLHLLSPSSFPPLHSCVSQRWCHKNELNLSPSVQTTIDRVGTFRKTNHHLLSLLGIECVYVYARVHVFCWWGWGGRWGRALCQRGTQGHLLTCHPHSVCWTSKRSRQMMLIIISSPVVRLGGRHCCLCRAPDADY